MNLQELYTLYTREFETHLDNGDDELNAKLRIIEQGCPLDIADAIEKEHEEEE